MKYNINKSQSVKSISKSSKLIKSNTQIQKKQLGGGISFSPRSPLFNINSPVEQVAKLDKNFRIIPPNYSTVELLEDTLPIIKKFEKYKGNIYKDATGKPTIGYGETRPEYIKKKFITEPDATTAVKDYMQKNVLPVLQKKPYFNSLNPNKKIALADLIYNIGQTKFNASPNLQKALHKND